MGCHVGYIYVRGEFIREREVLEAAIAEARDARLIGRNNINGWDFDSMSITAPAPIYAARRRRCSRASRARRASPG